MVEVPAQSFFADRRRALLPTLLGAAIAGAGLWLALVRREREVGMVAFAWGLLFVGWFGRKLGRRPMLWFDGGGLRAHLPGFGQVPWRQIEAVRLQRLGRLALLVIDRSEQARRLNRASSWARACARLAGAKDLAVPVQGLSATPEQIAAVVDLAWRHVLAARTERQEQLQQRQQEPPPPGREATR